MKNLEDRLSLSEDKGTERVGLGVTVAQPRRPTSPSHQPFTLHFTSPHSYRYQLHFSLSQDAPEGPKVLFFLSARLPYMSGSTNSFSQIRQPYFDKKPSLWNIVDYLKRFGSVYFSYSDDTPGDWNSSLRWFARNGTAQEKTISKQKLTHYKDRRVSPPPTPHTHTSPIHRVQVSQGMPDAKTVELIQTYLVRGVKAAFPAIQAVTAPEFRAF